MQCNWGLIRRQACFWQNSGLACQSPTSLSLYALGPLISTEYRHIHRASIAEVSVSLAEEDEIKPSLDRISGAKSGRLPGKRFPACAAESRLRFGNAPYIPTQSDITIVGYGRGTRLLSSPSTVQGAGAAPAQISVCSSPLMFTDCRNQREATKLRPASSSRCLSNLPVER